MGGMLGVVVQCSFQTYPWLCFPGNFLRYCSQVAQFHSYILQNWINTEDQSNLAHLSYWKPNVQITSYKNPYDLAPGFHPNYSLLALVHSTSYIDLSLYSASSSTGDFVPCNLCSCLEPIYKVVFKPWQYLLQFTFVTIWNCHLTAHHRGHHLFLCVLFHLVLSLHRSWVYSLSTIPFDIWDTQQICLMSVFNLCVRFPLWSHCSSGIFRLKQLYS